jgi:hypothetical protein
LCLGNAHQTGEAREARDASEAHDQQQTAKWFSRVCRAGIGKT